MQQDKFIAIIQEIVTSTLKKLGLLNNEWHLGKVHSIAPNGMLNVYIDGSTYVTPNIPCNPDITFLTNDEVWVHFINRNQSHLFVPYKRQVT